MSAFIGSGSGSFLGSVGSTIQSAVKTVSSDFSSVTNAASNLLSQAFCPPTLDQTNPNYLVRFKGTDEVGNKINFVAAMPEVFDIQTSADFRPLLPDGSIVESLGKLLGPNAQSIIQSGETLANTTTGYAFRSVDLSKLVWTSVSPLTFSLPIQLNAIYDARKEVVDIVRQLLSLTLPTVDKAGTLRAPGPTPYAVSSKYASKYKMTMSIGRTLKFTNVVFLAVQAQIDTVATSKGDFISAQLHISVSTDRIYGKQDLDAAFAKQNQPSSYSPGMGKSILSTAGANAAKAIPSLVSTAKSFL